MDKGRILEGEGRGGGIGLMGLLAEGFSSRQGSPPYDSSASLLET